MNKGLCLDNAIFLKIHALENIGDIGNTCDENNKMDYLHREL